MNLHKVYYDAMVLDGRELLVTLALPRDGCPSCRLQRALSAQCADLVKLMVADGHRDPFVSSQPSGGYTIACSTCGVSIRLLPFGVRGMRVGPIEPMSHWACHGGR